MYILSSGCGVWDVRAPHDICPRRFWHFRPHRDILFFSRVAEPPPAKPTSCEGEYRVTSIIRNSPLPGAYSRTRPRVLSWS